MYPPASLMKLTPHRSAHTQVDRIAQGAESGRIHAGCDDAKSGAFVLSPIHDSTLIHEVQARLPGLSGRRLEGESGFKAEPTLYQAYGVHLLECQQACGRCPRCKSFTYSIAYERCVWWHVCNPVPVTTWQGGVVPVFRMPALAALEPRALVPPTRLSLMGLEGHCGGTQLVHLGGQCARRESGGFALTELLGDPTDVGPTLDDGLTHGILARCAKRCLECSNSCAFVSVSLYNDDCSCAPRPRALPNAAYDTAHLPAPLLRLRIIRRCSNALDSRAVTAGYRTCSTLSLHPGGYHTVGVKPDGSVFRPRLSPPRPGYCGKRHDDVPVRGCKQFLRGVPTLRDCALQCLKCNGCRYATFSARMDDCSLYARCDLDQLAHGHGYWSVEASFASSLLNSSLRTRAQTVR
jgi:hypothetical protein